MKTVLKEKSMHELKKGIKRGRSRLIFLFLFVFLTLPACEVQSSESFQLEVNKAKLKTSTKDVKDLKENVKGEIKKNLKEEKVQGKEEEKKAVKKQTPKFRTVKDVFLDIKKEYKEEIANNEALILVVKHIYKLYYFENGVLKKSYEIGLGMNPLGHKQRRGDNRTPEGEYHIVQKAKGPFGNSGYLRYLGKRWMRVNYPNANDAASGLKRGLINKKQHDQMVWADNAKREAIKNTALGGGIGLHGWIESDWDDRGDRNLTWGCILMHNKDIEELYDMVKIPTKIIIRR